MNAPCFFCARTDITPDDQCPWGCALWNPPEEDQ